MKKLLAIWTLEKLQDNPELFGGDYGNLHMMEYLLDTVPDDKISSITLQTSSNAVTVSRLKNELLRQYPNYDFRVKYRAKNKDNINPNQGILFSFRELIGEDEQRIFDYLNKDKERWNYTPGRIKKSIVGANLEDIKCVLKHRELYQKGDEFKPT